MSRTRFILAHCPQLNSDFSPHLAQVVDSRPVGSIGHLCRICADDSHSFKSINDLLLCGKMLYQVINDLCQIYICAGDELPEFICRECHDQLLEFQKFKEKSHRGQSSLIRLKYGLEKVAVKEEPLDDDEVETATAMQEHSTESTDNSCNEDAEEILPDIGSLSCLKSKPKVEMVESLDSKVIVKIEEGEANFMESIEAEPCMSSISTEDQLLPEVTVEIKEGATNFMESIEAEPCTSIISTADHLQPEVTMKIEEGVTCFMESIEAERRMSIISTQDQLLSEASHYMVTMPSRKPRGRAPSTNASPSQQARLEALRLKGRVRREQETPEQKEKRLKCMREGQKKRLAQEGPEERALRLQKLRQNSDAQLFSEGPQQKVDRLWKMRLSQSRRLAKESREEREERLLRLRLNQVNRRERLGQGCHEDGRERRWRQPEEVVGGRQNMTVFSGPMGIDFSEQQSLSEEPDASGVRFPENKMSRRSSKGIPMYNEELLGLPSDFPGTFEDILGPEDELKISVARKSSTRRKSRKGVQMDPHEVAGDSTIVVNSDAISGENPPDLALRLGELHPGENLVSSIDAGVNGDTTGGSDSVQHNFQVSDKSLVDVNRTMYGEMDGLSLDHVQPDGVSPVGSNGVPSAYAEPLAVDSNPGGPMRMQIAGEGPCGVRQQCKGDILECVMEKDSAGKFKAGPAHGWDETLTQGRLGSGDGHVGEATGLRNTRPKRKSCGLVNYSEYPSIGDGRIDDSDAAEGWLSEGSDLELNFQARKGKVRRKGGRVVISGCSGPSNTRMKQALCRPDSKLKLQGSKMSHKTKDSCDIDSQESNFESSNILEKDTVCGNDLIINEQTKKSSPGMKDCSNLVPREGTVEASGTSSKIASRPDLKQKHQSRRRLLKKNSVPNSDIKEDCCEVSENDDNQVCGGPDPKKQQVSRRKGNGKCSSKKWVSKGKCSSEGQTVVMTTVHHQALDMRESVASSDHSMGQNSEQSGIHESVKAVQPRNSTEAELLSPSHTESPRKQMCVPFENRLSAPWNGYLSTPDSLSKEQQGENTVGIFEADGKSKISNCTSQITCPESPKDVPLSTSPSPELGTVHSISVEPNKHESDPVWASTSSDSIPHPSSGLEAAQLNPCDGNPAMVQSRSPFQENWQKNVIYPGKCVPERSHEKLEIGVVPSEVVLPQAIPMELETSISDNDKTSKTLSVGPSCLSGLVPSRDAAVLLPITGPAVEMYGGELLGGMQLPCRYRNLNSSDTSEVTMEYGKNRMDMECSTLVDRSVVDPELVNKDARLGVLCSQEARVYLDNVGLHSNDQSDNFVDNSTSSHSMLSDEALSKPPPTSGHHNGLNMSQVSSGIDGLVDSTSHRGSLRHDHLLPSSEEISH